MDGQLDPFLAAAQELKVKTEEYFLRGQIIAVCESMLTEELGIIPGSRRLKSLGLRLSNGHDEDFSTFLLIDSETDHLPVDLERHNWSAEALSRKDKEIVENERFYRADALAACRRLVERFGINNEI